MNLRTSILVQILADTDALFIPNRSWSRRRVTNIYFGQKNYGRSGVVWSSGAATEADRKAAQRELEALAKERLVRVFRPNRVKTLGVRLTDAGEALARRLCGLPAIECGWWTCHELVRHSKTPSEAKTLDDVWISEVQLAGVDWPREGEDTTAFRREMVLVEDMALPAFLRGWITSNSDRHGRVYYALTLAGWEVLDNAPPDDTPDTPVDIEAREAYLARVQYASDRLDTADPEDPKEIGGLPLPVALKGVRLASPFVPVAPVRHPSTIQSSTAFPWRRTIPPGRKDPQ